ncbi:sigma factor [Chitinophaga sp. CC14]|uniref:RNA polymerase sigma factor n=1 Tax=Chitinophaga sp. CC14 TaxID=3029199 RepID=UPI003B80BE82
MQSINENDLGLQGRDFELDFIHIYEQYAEELVDFSFNLVKNVDDALFLCNEVFAKLWLQRSMFTDTQSINAFLFVTTRNLCLNFLRGLHCKNLQSTSGLEQDLLVHVDFRSLYKEASDDLVSRLPEKFQALLNQGGLKLKV